MFPLLIPMAIGAAGGALTSKKPLKGALMGAGLGALGGAAAPAIGGLLGGGSAAAAGGAASSGAASAGFGLGQPLVTGTMGASEIAGTASGAGKMAGLLDTANKFSPLMGVGMQAMSQSGDEQPIQGAAPQVGQGGSEVLAGIANNSPSAQLAADAQARAQRRNARRFA